jgi:phosphate-selective porin
VTVHLSARGRWILLTAYLLLSWSSARAQSDSSSNDEDPLYWDNGLWFSRPRLQLKIGGQAQLDTAGFVSDQQEFALENGVEWRRAQIYTNIQVGKRISFKFQWGFQGQPPRLKDAWMQVLLPKLNVFMRGGRFSSTFGLEKETSSNDLMFLEESLVTAFVPRQETGFLLHSQSNRRRWDIGFTSGAKEFECLLCNILGVTGRYSTGLELGRKDRLLHLGVDLSRRWYGSGETARIRARPESHLAPVFVDTGVLAADRADTALIETAFVNGRYSIQSESG